MQWNLLNEVELGPFKFLKLNYRRGDQIIQPFFTELLQEIWCPIFISGYFEKVKKYTVYLLKINQPFYRIHFPQELRCTPYLI